MTRIALFVLCSTLAIAAHAQATFDFKGVALRSSEAELVAAHPGFKCISGSVGGATRMCRLYPQDACAAGAQDCNAAQTYGGATYKSVTARFIDGVGLAGMTVYVQASGFKQLTDALTAKLGEPNHRSSETVRTKSGVAYENTELVWKSTRGDMLHAARFASDLDTSVVHLSTPEELAAFNSSKRQAARAGAGNL